MGLLLGIVVTIIGCFFALLLWCCTVVAKRTDKQIENWSKN